MNAQTILAPSPQLLFDLPLDEPGDFVEETVSGRRLPMSSTTSRVTDCLPAS